MTNRFDDIDQETLDQFGEVAADAATRSFQFLKLVVPSPGRPLDWRLGDIIVTDEEAIAIADESVMGWIRFKGKEMVEEHWVKQLGNKKPSRPNSFTDKTKWELWPGTDRPKDPWAFQTKLALKIMTGDMAGKVVLFNGDREGNRVAIGDVQSVFIEKRRRPLVKLTSVKRDYADVFDPILQIIGFSEDDSIIRGLNLAKDDAAIVAAPSKPPTNGAAGAAGVNTDVDDDIPFAPEFR